MQLIPPFIFTFKLTWLGRLNLVIPILLQGTKNKIILSCVTIVLMLHSKVGDYSYPGKSCLDILQRTKGTSLSNGEYWIALDSTPLKVYCDMKADGGIYLDFLYF
jgi:hypothetical protein